MHLESSILVMKTCLVGLINNMVLCPEFHLPDAQYLWNKEQSQCHSDGGMSVCEDEQKGPVRMKTGIGKPEDG